MRLNKTIGIMLNIIGREYEMAELQRLKESKSPELVAVYGRRRVGKTFLIREFFQNQFAFYHTGVSPLEVSGKQLMKRQLEEFFVSLRDYGLKDATCPASWPEAFRLLRRLLEQLPDDGKHVVFLDELPWMDTPRSGFITAFEHFWNGWASSRPELLFIVCGSATSWIKDNLINNKGGLYGRITYELKLAPFSLHECEALYKDKGIELDRYDIVQSYMAIGGIPYYMNYFRQGLSLAQNIDRLFFVANAPLHAEFDRLFHSLFGNAEESAAIVRLLASRRFGFTRKEISAKTGIASGGTLSKTLAALVNSDFVMPFTPIGEGREVYYKLIDNFCLFYLNFVEGKNITDEQYWQHSVMSPALSAWQGFAFEEVCFSHSRQIKGALGISGVQTQLSSLIIPKDDSGAGTQIDLIIDRADRVINLCEIKFTNKEYVIDSDYEQKLRYRVARVRELTKDKKNIHLTLITTYGLHYNPYSGRIQKTVVMDDLFERDKA